MRRRSHGALRARLGVAAVVLLAGAAVGCSDDSDDGDSDGGGSDGANVCAEMFLVGESGPADTASFVVESPGAQGDEVAGAVECVDEAGDEVFKTVFRFDCDDGRAAYYVGFSDSDYVAWEDGGAFFSVPLSPGPGASNLCV
ncbi:MAG: hypothetical protein AAFY28_17970 [Actinomycetota bacterium]